MRRSAIIVAAALALLILALALKPWLVAAPELSRPSAGEFDADRAVSRLARILGDQRPHPVDTPADDAVRARLVAELRGIGLAPRETDSWACGGGKGGPYAACARVRNVVATIGPSAGRHVLLASHYDSTPAGPGAADDGIGVATMLEIASLIKDRRLARPVTFLFDEGEEAGLLGAHAFLDRDPLAGQVESLVNFEARGVTGPATMFETSRPNGSAIAAFQASSARPVANSMTADFYRLIPNSTDVTVFAARPWTMLNFAVIGNETRYHSPGDTVAALDRRSVGHMGSQGLAAALQLAEHGAHGGGERLYADVLGRFLVSVPKAAGLAAFALLFAGTVVFAWTRRGHGLGRGIGAMVLAIAGSAALVWLLQGLVGLLRAGLFWRAHPGVLAVAVDLAALAACAGTLTWFVPDVSRERLRAAFWLVFMLLSLAIAVAAPGGAIFSLAPPLVMLVGAAAGRRSPRAEAIAAVVAWALLFLTWAPLVHLAQVLLDFRGAWLFAPFSALLVLPALVELQVFDVRRMLVALSAAAAFAGWAAVAAVPAYSADRKQGFRVGYGWDADAGKGQWLVANGGVPLPKGFPDRGRFQPNVRLGWAGSTRWAAPAPALPVPPPRVDKVAERAASGGRVVTLRFSMNGADDLTLRFPAAAGVREVRIGGAVAPLGKAGEGEASYIRCTGRSCDGATMDVLLAAPAPVELTAVGIRNALPAAAAPFVRARPATAQAQYSPDTTMSWTRIEL